ncbi:MAG: NifB/NifX family molybdenum-iron cluster-binding protein [Thermodesulfobacteriota bacterium]
MKRILIPLWEDNVAPRFDLAQEALIVLLNEKDEVMEKRIIILSHASAESFCNLIINEKVDTVVCCGIEEEFYQFLTWKKVKVLDSVMGSSENVLERIREGTLSEGAMLM